MDEDDFKFKKLLKVTNRKRRFEAFHHLLKGKEKKAHLLLGSKEFLEDCIQRGGGRKRKDGESR